MQFRSRFSRLVLTLTTAAAIGAVPLSATAATCGGTYGDLDGTGSVTIIDLQCMILVTLAEIEAVGTVPTCVVVPPAETDVTCDGYTNISDVLVTIAIALDLPLDSALDSTESGCVDACEEPSDTVAPFEGALVITEVLANPSAVSDFAGEWFEVVNTTDQALSLDGLVLADDGDDYHEIAAGYVVEPGDSFVFGRNGDSGLNGGVAVDYQYAGMVLSNTGDELLLWYDGITIDYIAYDDGTMWPYGPGIAMALGYESMEASANDSETAWCAAEVPFGSGDTGTPGAMNETCSDCGDGSCDVGETCESCPTDCGACPPVCVDACEMGISECQGDLIAPCVMGPLGCTVLDEAEPCGAGLSCEAGACVPACTDACTLGVSECVGTLIAPCVTGPLGCALLDEAEPCGGGDVCVEGECVEPCADACDIGETTCDGTDVRPCVAGPAGCNIWGPAEACPGDQICSLGGSCGLVIDSSQELCGEHTIDGAFVLQGGAAVTCSSGELTIRAKSIFIDPASSISVDGTSSDTSGGLWKKCSGCCNSNGIASGAGGGGNGTGGGQGGSSQYRVKACGEYCGGWWGWSCTSCSGASGGGVRGGENNLELQPGGRGGNGCYSVNSGCNTTIQGGNGGGIVRLYSESTLQIFGSVSARGADGNDYIYEIDAGAGGGAGGSILLYAPTVMITGSVDTSGGDGSAGEDSDYDCDSFDTSGGDGGNGRVKIASATPATVTGSIVGAVLTESLMPPLEVTSPTHGDLGIPYFDTLEEVVFQWDAPSEGVKGYWYVFSKGGFVDVTPANGTYTELPVATIDWDTLGANTAGNWWLHIVSVNEADEVGTMANRFRFQVMSLPPVATSTSHPDPNAWYPDEAPHVVSFDFDPPSGVPTDAYNGYWYRLDRNSDYPAGKAAEGFTFTESSQVILTEDWSGQDIGDGAWTLHLVAEDQNGNLPNAPSHTVVQLGEEPSEMNFFGYVWTADNFPIEGAIVHLEPYGLTQTTDLNGYFLFENCYAMTYAISVDAPGYDLYWANIDVDPAISPMTVNLSD